MFSCKVGSGSAGRIWPNLCLLSLDIAVLWSFFKKGRFKGGWSLAEFFLKHKLRFSVFVLPPSHWVSSLFLLLNHIQKGQKGSWRPVSNFPPQHAPSISTCKLLGFQPRDKTAMLVDKTIKLFRTICTKKGFSLRRREWPPLTAAENQQLSCDLSPFLPSSKDEISWHKNCLCGISLGLACNTKCFR